MGVEKFILIKIYETPPYSTPSVDNIDFPAPNQIIDAVFRSEAKYFEIWTLDPIIRLASKSGK